MGNSNQRQSISTNVTSSPPRKRAKNLNGSISLRSIASLASNHFPFKDSNNLRKRKHVPETPSTSSGSLLSIERHWAYSSFEPEFPWTTDVCESDFVILNVLGKGRFATVYRALDRTSSKQVAIKIQTKAKILKAGAEEQIKNEVTVQRLLGKNNFIAEFFASWQTSCELFTIMSYVDGIGDLFSLFSEYGHFSEQVTCLYSVEIALGLQFLHNRSIIHRDLKMENLSLDANLHIKFVDFGFSKRLHPPDNQTHSICGTLQFLAPEIAKEQPYSYSVDWWSYGVTLFVMRTGQYPFPNSYVLTHNDLVYDRKEFPETCSEELKSILEKLLQIDPNQRLCSADELFSHPFYENVNIEGIKNQDVCPFEILKAESKTTDRITVKMQAAFDEHYTNFDFY